MVVVVVVWVLSSKRFARSGSILDYEYSGHDLRSLGLCEELSIGMDC